MNIVNQKKNVHNLYRINNSIALPLLDIKNSNHSLSSSNEQRWKLRNARRSMNFHRYIKSSEKSALINPSDFYYGRISSLFAWEFKMPKYFSRLMISCRPFSVIFIVFDRSAFRLRNCQIKIKFCFEFL